MGEIWVKSGVQLVVMDLTFDGSSWVCVMSALGRPRKRSGLLQYFCKYTTISKEKVKTHPETAQKEDPPNAQMTSHSGGAFNPGSHGQGFRGFLTLPKS